MYFEDLREVFFNACYFRSFKGLDMGLWEGSIQLLSNSFFQVPSIVFFTTIVPILVGGTTNKYANKELKELSKRKRYGHKSSSSSLL